MIDYSKHGPDLIKTAIQELEKKFQITDEGEVDEYLGAKVAQE